MPAFEVSFTDEAQEDLLRLFAYLVQHDVDAAVRARQTIEDSFAVLEHFPFTCRKAKGGDSSPFLRELLIPFGASGYLALFEITDGKRVTVLAVRHQREDDYH
jgi:plasmid stabilization system protein ParE